MTALRRARGREWQNAMQARQDGVDRQGIVIIDPAVGRLGRLKEGDGYDMVRDGIALFPPGTCTDHLPKMAGGFRHRDAVAGFSRPWWLRCLLPAGRSAQPMRTSRGLNAPGPCATRTAIFAAL
ncbi:hypothetical protein B5V01_03670 [Mesorhizobium erdmanii]|uniref:Uncharacterized protein n=1 Tax=Mesorhizobium erdmanii TaxID=1777866 RepID=A0A4Q1VGH6_9HYPH|nr:hypothetical protein B5V01_03670 [Mesorhizobium erdmanii]